MRSTWLRCFLPDFAHKFGKARGASQIQRAARFAPMAVSTRYERALPALGQFHGGVIFFRAAHGIEFEGVQESHAVPQKPVQRFAVLLLTHAALVPERMVEDQ